MVCYGALFVMFWTVVVGQQHSLRPVPSSLAFTLMQIPHLA